MEPGRGGERALVGSLRALLRATPRLSPTLLIVALLVCVLVPLANPVVDVLLSLSLAASVLLLVVSLTIRRSAEFLAFPSLLLLATLYRLALNVQTTRLILSNADAGRVIDAFASVVVRDELVVGAIMFTIITAVQFLVITRGSERVAEVAARFALDGLPGQQAAIDADLRAGAISAQEAARRRSALIERSNFYGAMDGAVRFVKGDAIAGLSITVINVVGGLIIGVAQKGGTLGDALGTYGRLAIGDGLMAQIPALLVSLAAGVLVARVDREDVDEGRLGWLEPAALAIPAVLLGALAVVPDMPTAAFLVTASGLVCAALWLGHRRALRGDDALAPPRPQISVALARGHAEGLGLRGTFDALRRQCRDELGVDVPPIVVTAAQGPRGSVRVHLGRRLLGEQAGLAERDDDALIAAVHRILMREAAALVDVEDVERAVEAVRRQRPALVREALKIVSLTELLALWRGFLREELAAVPMEALLAAVTEQPLLGERSERGRFVALARLHLAAYWAPALVASLRKRGPVCWLRPYPDAEEALLSNLVEGSGGAALAISPRARARWRAAIVARGAGTSAAILTTPRARGAFATLTAGLHPRIPVLSTAELDAIDLAADGETRWFDEPDDESTGDEA
ncbi:MAG: FHIPEP family type III secretion protein [Myxococcales bacterium]|nr:FHIPEP family type III secretion protein [Myxococcales bacterium]